MKNRENIHDNWETPPFILNRIRELFGDYFDPCPINHDLNEWDGLETDWFKQDKLAYCNPPYNLKDKTDFIKKAVVESFKGPVLCLIPDARDTQLYYNMIDKHKTIEVPVKSRIPFIGINTHGQCVNYHLKQEIDKSEFLKSGLPKYVKANGQHASVFVLFDKLNIVPQAEQRMNELRDVVITHKRKSR